jgi:uncharacterized protein (TIGR02271 family)
VPGERTIVAVFRNQTDAETAAADLQTAGISRKNIYLETEAGELSRSKTSQSQGGLTGWLKSIFSEDNPDRTEYETALKQGNCLLAVETDENNISVIENVLNRHSPVDVHAEGVAARAGEKGRAIPVVKEEVQVGKRQVLRGGVRVYSRVVEEPVEETVKLREERVRVERRPVDRAATAADLSAGQENVIEAQEFAEEPVVAKQARVVEEVRVGKDVSERTETVRDTVRHTEVNVEQAPGTGGPAFDDSDFRSDFKTRYAATGASYETYSPAYRYGYEMASDPRYKGRSFDQVESDLRSEYGRQYPQSAWDKMKDAVRYGWNKVSSKAQATGR